MFSHKGGGTPAQSSTSCSPLHRRPVLTQSLTHGTMADYYNTTTPPTGIPNTTSSPTTTTTAAATATGNGSLGEGSLGGGLGAGGLGGPSEDLQTALGVVLTAMLGVLVFSLGCTVQASRLWAHLRRPWGVLVGLACQFGLMPLTAFLLARGLGVPPLQAVAVLVMGCCPGGVISNVVTYWLDGDMDLRYWWWGCVVGLC